MSPKAGAEEAETEKAAVKAENETESKSAAATKAAAKRRTKTGCLTCRKRRIKCGEEKPSCKNCIKSKRDCAGYVQPLIYKNHGAHMVHHDSTGSAVSEQEHYHFNTALDHGHERHDQPQYNPFVGLQQHVQYHPTRSGSQQWPQHFQYPIPDPSNPHIGVSPVEASVQPRRHSEHALMGPYQHQQAPPYFEPHGYSRQHHWPLHSVSFGDRSHVYPEPESASTTSYEPYPPSRLDSVSAHATPLHEIYSKRYSAHGFVEAHTYKPGLPTLPQPQPNSVSLPQLSPHDDDPYDVDSDEPGNEDAVVFEQASGGNFQRRSQAAYRQYPLEAMSAIRTTHRLNVATPLQEERNRHLLHHFNQVTGRCMNIFERLPSDPWAMPRPTLWSYTLPAVAVSDHALAYAILALSGLHIAKLQQTSEDLSLKHFTYALRRVGKLLGKQKHRHDIATLATVLLLGFYEVMAADHSRWTLHLAGAMKLLVEDEYEARTAQVHRTRSRAKQNLVQFANHSMLDQANILDVAGIPRNLLGDTDWELDIGLISRLMGINIDDDFRSHAVGDDAGMSVQEVEDMKAKADLRWWYCKQDVFQSLVSGDRLLMPYEEWQYCLPRGQIGVVSIAYATFDHLLLLMARLTDWAGKDRIRKQRSVIAQGGQWRPPADFFTANKRVPPAQNSSQSVRTAQAGSGTDAPDVSTSPSSFSTTKPSPAPTANEKRVRQNKPPSQGPGFHGMMPPPQTPVKMSASFHAMNDQINFSGLGPSQSKRRPSVHEELERETEKALAEHTSICEAFELFARSLGSDFDAISDERQLQSSPFGPLLVYRDSRISCIWAHYNVGRMLLHRLHPSMPPAAMVAASVTAHLTKEYAQNVGKICAGLCASVAGDHLDPDLAGALIETTFPLLFAGVQYQEAAQRGWTIAKLHDIARMTGWQTSASIAAACETAWEKTGQAGRGPPYTRSLDRNHEDSRVNGLSRLSNVTDRSEEPEGRDAVHDHVSQFVSHDREEIGKHGSTRVHWAFGLLSVEEDIGKLNLGGG